jgi:hypothetical protein
MLVMEIPTKVSKAYPNSLPKRFLIIIHVKIRLCGFGWARQGVFLIVCVELIYP